MSGWHRAALSGGTFQGPLPSTDPTKRGGVATKVDDAGSVAADQVDVAVIDQPAPSSPRPPALNSK